MSSFITRLLASPRTVYGLVLLSCVALLGTGLFMEHVVGLYPCPLCMVQRIFYVAVGIVALVGLLHGSRGIINKLNAIILAIFAAGGAAVAARQVWLQSLPPGQAPACGADFDYIVGNFPILKAIETLWKGSGDCAEIQWQFLGLSIAGWSFVWFSFFVILALYQLFKRFPSKQAV